MSKETKTDLLDTRRLNSVRDALREKGLYHSFRLPNGILLDGAMPLDYLEARLASFNLPLDLRGKRVLDIGPWDGYFTFAMEARGAEVVAIDYVDLDTFRALHAALGSRSTYLRLDLYELDPRQHGLFDYVLCLGVLYHLKHPLLALEKLCAITRQVCIVDTVVVDGEAWLNGCAASIPYIEFYERDELGGQLDNWSGPTVNAVQALVRAAGFAKAVTLRVTEATATIAAHRTWTNLPPDEHLPIQLLGINSHQDGGRTFVSTKEAYLVLWCAWAEPEPPSLDSVFPEIDGYGIAPLHCSMEQGHLLVRARMPPGVLPGAHEIRLKIGTSGWSRPERFYVDLPPITGTLRVASVQDGVTWTAGVVDWGKGGWLTIWVDGLSPEADCGNTKVFVAGVPHYPQAVVPTGQVNVRLRPIIGSGAQELFLEHRGILSDAVNLEVIGAPPIIAGLEKLAATRG